MIVFVLRTDGGEETHEVPDAELLPRLRRLLDADCFDSVNLRDGRRMFMDDNGYDVTHEVIGPGHIAAVPVRARKPVNLKATELYHRVCEPGTTHQIVGDVAICLMPDGEG